MRTRRTHLAAALCCTLAAPAMAGDLRVPSERAPTLKVALERAQPGDRIMLGPGEHTGGATNRDLSGLTIVGRRASVDRDVSLQGDGITVRGVEFWASRLTVRGDDARIERCRFEFNDQGAVEVHGDDALVRRNRFRSSFGQAAILVNGERARVERNVVREVEDAFRVVGDQARVRANRVSNTELVTAVEGDEAQVTKNRLVNVDVGVLVSGDEADVTRNRLMGAFFGIQVEGDGFDVSRNRVGLGRVVVTRTRFRFQPGGDGNPLGPVEIRIRKTVDYFPTACPAIVAVNDEGGGTVERNVVLHEIGGVAFDLMVEDATVADNTSDGPGRSGTGRSMVVQGRGNAVRNNRVRGFQLVGMRVLGDQNDVRDNDVVSGAGTAIDVYGNENAVCENVVAQAEFRSVHVEGDQNTVETNHVRQGFNDAFCVVGDGNSVSGNRVPMTYDDGFVVYGSDNVLTDNVVSNALRDGFRIAQGSDNTLSDCRATGCGADGLANLAERTSVIDSRFTGNGTDLDNAGTFLSLERAIFGRAGR